ncbi:unnamed protein product [Dicrocoelium dendriticum]|nr:unnamed protein product [Dicrocoelium dendriticum]
MVPYSVITIIVIFTSLLGTTVANNYDDYIARLVADSKALHEDFLRTNPSAHEELKKLSTPDFDDDDHPEYPHEIDNVNWLMFMNEMQQDQREATSPVTEIPVLEPPRYSGDSSSLSKTRDSYPDTHETASRRTEFIYPNPLWGTHKVSGGSSETGEWINYAVMGAGLQDDDGEEKDLTEGTGDEEVPGRHFEYKNDSLPSYCDPPNPCPIGYDPEKLPSPCDENVVYTMEFNRDWVRSKVADGECSCDKEHMFYCDSGTSPMFSGERYQHKVNRENPYLKGPRRKQLSTKKSTQYSTITDASECRFMLTSSACSFLKVTLLPVCY